MKKMKSRVKKHMFLHWMILSTLAAIAVTALFTFVYPLLRVTEGNVSSTLEEEDVLIVEKYGTITRGDLVAFTYADNVLIRRCIGLPGDWVDLDENGIIYVNGTELEETYVTNRSAESNLVYPYQVPENRYFLLADDRTNPADSRITSIGCISKMQMIGKAVLRIWPLTKFQIY